MIVVGPGVACLPRLVEPLVLGSSSYWRTGAAGTADVQEAASEGDRVGSNSRGVALHEA